MKKALSLLLVLAMCLSLCACGGGTDEPETTEATTEIISENTLFLDKTNGAKCQLNVGKQVTVLGKIESIGKAYCRVQLVSHPEESVSIAMSIEELAKLSVDQFIAVTGIVESYDGGRYSISATEKMDNEAMHTFFRENTAKQLVGNSNHGSYGFMATMHIVYDFMSCNSSLYTKQNNEELKEYLCGKWDCGSFLYYNPNSLSDSIFRSFDITYNEDWSVEYSEYNSWRDDWGLDDNGKLQSFFGEKRVLILSDNVFFCEDYVFVREK